MPELEDLIVRRRERVVASDVNMSRLHFAAWYRWMDRALADWFAEAGHGLGSLAEDDLAPVVVHSECDYLVKVSMDEVLEVRAGVTDAHRTSFSVTYVFLREGSLAPEQHGPSTRVATAKEMRCPCRDGSASS